MNKIFTSKARALLLCFFILLILPVGAIAQTIAFPGAEGAGRFTSGGRGTAASPTKVFEVTNLTDQNTEGSLRYACSQSTATYPYRTIIFRISGTIHLGSKLSIPKNTTIAGQTAPGDGICIADYPVVISGDNVIIRYIRCRMGDRYQNKGMVDGSGSDDALGNLGSKNIIIDHCSISWSSDEALTIYRGDSITVQWNLISEPLNYSYHFETGDTDFEHHGYGGIWGSRHGSFHHNLIAHCKNRTPRFAGVSTYTDPAQGAEMCDFSNNVLYNWGINNVYGGEGGYYNMVNNYYKYGPSTTSRKYQVVAVDYSDEYPYAKYYLKGNYVDGSATNTNNNWLSVSMKSGNLADTVLSKVTTPFDLPAITLQTAANAYNSVLAEAGASFPKRDTLDERIILDVKNRTGKLIDVQGGFAHGTDYSVSSIAWPVLNSGAAPADTDHDGMPDAWETSKGLNPNDSADRNTKNADGYTMLEVYLNNLITAIPVIEETTASATWALTANQQVATSGNITASAQTMHANMSVKNYNNFTAGSANNSSFVPYTAQRVFPNGGNTTTPIGWPGNQTGSVSNQYVQYIVAPLSGKVFTVTNVSFDFGPAGSTNVMKANIEYSLDGFATAGIRLNGETPLTLPPAVSGDNNYITVAYSGLSIKVASGETLTFRVYPWWPSSASNTKYFVEKNVLISGTTATVLPLNLISFNGSIANKLTRQVNLNWSTTNEVNTKNFEILRSTDSKSFSKIAEVTARNFSSASNYSFLDSSPFPGTCYYRLKMNDRNGDFTYSHIISIKNLENEVIQLYPNPVQDKVNVTYEPINQAGSIFIINSSGKTMLNQTVSANSVKTEIDISKLTKGVYLLLYQNGNYKYSEKLIKQ